MTALDGCFNTAKKAMTAALDGCFSSSGLGAEWYKMACTIAIRHFTVYEKWKKRREKRASSRTASDRKSPYCTYKDNLVCITHYVINVSRTASDRKSPYCTYKDNLVCITHYVINVARNKTDIFLRYVHAHFSQQPFNIFAWDFF